MSMPEMGGQDRQAPLGNFPLAIPAQQGLDRKTMLIMPISRTALVWEAPAAN
jgi:hypothetical protein